jgi:hypothetical protein
MENSCEKTHIETSLKKLPNIVNCLNRVVGYLLCPITPTSQTYDLKSFYLKKKTCLEFQKGSINTSLEIPTKTGFYRLINY